MVVILLPLQNALHSQYEYGAYGKSTGLEEQSVVLFTHGLLLDSIPAPHMLKEPDYTRSDSNFVFWRHIEMDSIPIPPDSIRHCVVKVVAINTVTGYTAITVWQDCTEDSLVCKSLSVDTLYCYRAQIWVETIDEDTLHGPWSDSVCSTQDTIPPVTLTDSVWVEEANNRGWANRYALTTHYTVTDPSGIDSIFLYWRPCEETSWDSVTGEANLTLGDTVSGHLTWSSQEDGCYEFYVAAKDSAHSPLSREGNWIVDGNKKIPEDTIVHDSIKIDTQDPFSKVICDSLSDTTRVSEFKVWFTAKDTAYPSGPDTVWLYARYRSNSFVPVCTLAGFPDSSSVETFCPFEADSGDGWYYFYTIAKDKAGNRQSVASNICSTYVKIGVSIVYFEMCDLVDTTDCTYTNHSTVRVDLKFRGDPTHIYNVHFYSDTICCGDPDSSYHKWPGSQYPSHDDTMWASGYIPLPDSLEEGVKRTWCQVEDVTAGNDKLILSDNCPYDSIVLDTTGPTIGRLQLIDPTLDTLICDSDTIVFPFPGWTNETLVWARLIGLRDNLSHIDSLRFNCQGTRDSTFDFDCSYVFICDKDTMVKIPLTDGEELKEVCCGALDSAGNWGGTTVYDSIRLDTNISPISVVLHSLTCNPEFTDTFTVEVIFNGGDDDLVKAIIWDESDSVHTVKCEGYKDTVLFDLNPIGIGWRHVWATVWDSAGNNTKAMDSIFYYYYPPPPYIVPEPQYTPGTTNTICWHEVAFIDYFEAQCLDRLCENIVSDTVIADTCVTFTDLEDGTTYCYRVRGIIAIDSDTIYTRWSNTVSSTQDATPPDLDSVFILEAGLVVGKKWVYNRDIHIQILAKDSPPGKIFGYAITENGEETKRDSFTPDSVIEETISHHLSSEEKTSIEIGIFVWDCDVKRKSNVSDTLFETIYLEEIAEDIAIFPNPFNPDKGQEAVIRLRETNYCRAKIYDVFGNLVRILRKDGEKHEFVWDGKNDNGDIVAMGGYICVVGKYEKKVAVTEK